MFLLLLVKVLVLIKDLKLLIIPVLSRYEMDPTLPLDNCLELETIKYTENILSYTGML